MVEVARRYYPFDAMTSFIEALTLTSSDVVASGGSDVILTMGEGVFDADWIVDFSALKVSAGDEVYTLILQGSDSSTFASGIENLAVLNVGAASPRLGATDVASAIGRYAVPVTNLINGSSYKYLRIEVVIAGTSPSITFDSWLAKRTV